MHYRTAVVIVAVAIAGTTIGAFAWTSSREPVPAAISIDRAREIALAQALGGTIAEEELEREGDASIYSFDIRLADGRLVEVEIDAMTGAVLGDDEESAEDDSDDPMMTRTARINAAAVQSEISATLCISPNDSCRLRRSSVQMNHSACIR